MSGRSVSTHALNRSILKLATTAVRDVRTKDAREALSLIGDREEQFQIKVSGRASDFPAWQTADLLFDQTFSVATGNRMSQLTRPQVRSGSEVTSVASDFPPAADGTVAAVGVILAISVRQWLLDDAGNIRGARVQVGASSPGDNVRFTGFVHIAFHGYGALTEQPDTGD